MNINMSFTKLSIPAGRYTFPKSFHPGCDRSAYPIVSS